MDIIFTTLHHIDHAEKKVNKIDIGDQDNALAGYIQRLINEITDSPNKRSFVFQRDTTEIRSAINDLINENFAVASETIAARLLPIEQGAQKRIDRLGIEIQKGSLFQTIIDKEDGRFLIISKADHNEFLDENDFLIHKGLPWKKRIFKAFIAKIEEDKTLSSIFIYDTNTAMSRYWWDDFFELKTKHTDKHNTEKSLDSLDRKIFNPIKKEFPADHNILRNSTIGYFRNKEDFNLEEYVADIFEKYVPVADNFPLQRTKEKIIELPEKWDFDTRFSISKEHINKRAVNKIHLTENIELILRDYINPDDNTIESFLDAEGNKYIKIRTDTGYDNFRKQR